MCSSCIKSPDKSDSSVSTAISTTYSTPLLSSLTPRSPNVPVYFVQNIRVHNWCVLRIIIQEAKKIKRLLTRHNVRFKTIKYHNYIFFIVYMNFIHLNHLTGNNLSACDDYPRSLHTYV